jgi:hypothetical protein
VITDGQGSLRAGTIRGIKETLSRPSGRELGLYDASGTRVAALSIPDHNLTPRVVESLNEILIEIERHQGADPLVELARGARDKGLTDTLAEIADRYPHVLAEIGRDYREVPALGLEE